jgi:hypothetical protein
VHTLFRCNAIPASLRQLRRFLPVLCLLAPLAYASAQGVDATALRESLEIGTAGVVQAGDNPAYAQPDFDDSQWLPVNAKTRLNQYFPNNRQPILWRRIHVNVAPGEKHLALQAYLVSRAFEVYVNGQKIIQSGGVDPFIAYTRSARLIVPIPQAQLRTGSLVIAVRARAPRTWWSSPAPAFNAPMLTLGDENALSDRNLLSMIAESTANFLGNLFVFGVGLVAFALYIGQRQRKEYLWIFILGLLNLAFLPLLFLDAVRNIPVSLWIVNEILLFATLMAMVFMVEAFLPRRFGWPLWLCVTLACLTAVVCDIFYLYGLVPSYYDTIFTIGVGVIFAGVIPILLFRQWRRGDREAGVLFIPFLLYSLWFYEQILTGVLQLIPPLSGFALHISQLANGFPIGIFIVGLTDIANLSFYFSLVIIIVLRSTRMSRQQAILEGEMAAAREVQQVILPDQFEPVPGFAVESVYQPAQQVGGDFYQVLPTTDGGLLIVVGDVAGKGLPAAMLVSVLIGAIRTAAEDSHNPALMLRKLNNRLLGRSGGGFSTAIAAHITSDGWVFIASAGHLSPYLDGREIELPGALPLGLTDDAVYETLQLYLPPMSRLTFYSDGVVEAQNPNGQLFGFDRARSISTMPASIIAEAARQFGQSDDITVVAIQRAAAKTAAA